LINNKLINNKLINNKLINNKHQQRVDFTFLLINFSAKIGDVDKKIFILAGL